MRETVISNYDVGDTVNKVVEDLAEAGVPREKIYLNRKVNQIKFEISDTIVPKIMKILQRHHPIRVY